MAKRNQGIRIESKGAVAGPGTRIWIVDKNGIEQEISEYVRNAEVVLKCGELARVRLDVILLEWKSDAILDDLAVEWYGKRWRFTQRIRRKLRDITTHSSATRRYL